MLCFCRILQHKPPFVIHWSRVNGVLRVYWTDLRWQILLENVLQDYWKSSFIPKANCRRDDEFNRRVSSKFHCVGGLIYWQRIGVSKKFYRIGFQPRYHGYEISICCEKSCLSKWNFVCGIHIDTLLMWKRWKKILSFFVWCRRLCSS